MGNYPGNLRYSSEHEWARTEGKAIVVGVTDYAQESLGDVVYVELPKVGDSITTGKQIGVI
jgi:glycine cleavage system H protein